MGLEIANMLVLSTGHLTEKVGTTIGRANYNSIYEKGDHGYFVWVPGNDSEACMGSMPVCLHECIMFARGKGCQWIMFDQDGDRVEGLQFYDW